MQKRSSAVAVIDVEGGGNTIVELIDVNQIPLR
jgi:hypothetical protein